MNTKLMEYSNTRNFDIGKFIAQKLSSVRGWFQKINIECRNIELKNNRRRKMINQLEVETIENKPLELKSTLRVPR